MVSAILMCSLFSHTHTHTLIVFTEGLYQMHAFLGGVCWGILKSESYLSKTNETGIKSDF